MAPGLGDDIQAMKAGLLEIADIMVVNKADREGAERTLNQLTGATSLRAGNARKTNRAENHRHHRRRHRRTCRSHRRGGGEDEARSIAGNAGDGGHAI